jgi:hypothetical protein
MLRLATAPARFLLDELGQGAWKAVGTFPPLVARHGLKNVPTPIEIIAELLACPAGAVTESGALGTPSPVATWLTMSFRSTEKFRSSSSTSNECGRLPVRGSIGAVRSGLQPVTVRDRLSAGRSGTI